MLLSDETFAEYISLASLKPAPNTTVLPSKQH